MDVRATVLDVLEGHVGSLAAAWLFGSHAKGTAGARSDVDVAVLFREPAPARLDGPAAMLQGELERALGRTVDLIDMDRAPVDLAIRVMREGELLLDPDRSRRIRFEVRTRNLFFDLEPHLKRYRRPREADSR